MLKTLKMSLLPQVVVALPRFGDNGAFYHLTTTDGWQGIGANGHIRATREQVVRHLDTPALRQQYHCKEQAGVFTFDRDNFSRAWLREFAPYPNGTVSSADYHIRRALRRVAAELARGEGKSLDAPGESWADTLRFLKQYDGSGHGLVLLRIPQSAAAEEEVTVRDHGHFYNERPPVADNEPHRFTGFLNSARSLFSWRRETDKPDHAREFILPRDVPVAAGVEMAGHADVGGLLAMFPGKDGRLDPPQVRRLLLDA